MECMGDTPQTVMTTRAPAVLKSQLAFGKGLAIIRFTYDDANLALSRQSFKLRKLTLGRVETSEWRIEEESEERSVGQVLLCHMYTVAQCCAIFLCYQSSWQTRHKQSNADTRVDETDNQMNRVDETEFGLDGSKLTGGEGAIWKH